MKFIYTDNNNKTISYRFNHKNYDGKLMVYTIQQEFTGACELGYLHVAKWMLDILPNLQPSIIHMGFDYKSIIILSPS